MNRFFLIFVCLLAPLFSLIAQTSSDEIARAVKALGADSFVARETAAALLWNVGDDALDALRIAEKSQDTEMAQRATILIRNIESGILPGTPPEIVRLMVGFRNGTMDQRYTMLKGLARKKLFHRLLQLIRSEKNQEMRSKYVTYCRSNLRDIFQPMLEEGGFEQVEELLSYATDDEGISHYAVFLAIQGKQVAQLLKLNTAKPKEGLLAFYLLRSIGEEKRAVELAQKLGRADLLFLSYIEAGKWAELKALAPREPALFQDSLEGKGWEMTLARLSGDDERYQEGKKALLKRLEENKKMQRPANEAWIAMGVLTINEEVPAFLNYLKKWDAALYLQMMAIYGRVEEGLAGLGLADPEEDFEAWFLEISGKDDREQSINFVQLAKTLHELGLPQGEELVTRLCKDNAISDFGRARVQFLAGMPDPFIAGVKDLGEQQARSMATVMFSYLEPRTVQALWDYERSKHPKRDNSAALKQVQKWLTPSSLEEQRAEVENDLNELETRALARNSTHLFSALGEVYDQWGMLEDAERIYRRVVKSRKDPMKYLWLADHTFKQGKWEEAGTFYAKALERLRGGQHHAGLLFMQGYCQHKAGDAAGKTRMKIAESLLAGADHRTSLPIFLQERGLLAAARRQLEILVAIPNMQRFEEVNYCRTVLSSILMNNSVQHGKPKSVADCERAAALTQAYLLSQIMMHPEPLTLVQYQRLNTYIHEARGWSLLLSKRPEAAAHEAGKVLGLMFQAADFSECVVEALDKTGKKKLADDLTDLAFKPLDRICSTYPESAHYHNGRAWIGARHNRYLDKALTSARKAVALAPETSAYVDTLGEVLFRNGLVKEAIAACEKSILLEPHEPFFKKQYHRFSGKTYRAKSK